MPGCTHDRRRHLRLVLLVLAAHLVHVRRRAAEVADRRRSSRPDARSARTSRKHAVGRAALDDAPFVLGDAAEGAAAEAAAHGDDRVLHRLERRHRRVAVHRVRRAVERQIVELVHVRRLERQRGRVEVDAAGSPIALQQRARVVRVGLVLQDARRDARTSSCRRAPPRTTAARAPARRRRARDGSAASALRFDLRHGTRCRARRAARRSSRRRAAGARSPTPGARPCRRPGGRPWRRAGSSAAPCRDQ